MTSNARNTLPKASMLRLKREFEHVRAHGKRRGGRMMTLNIAPAPDGCSRVGIIVSRRYNTHAVDRNRARRLIRESFRHLRHCLKERAWLVVIARRAMHGQSMDRVADELATLLTGMGFLDPAAEPGGGA